MSGLQPVAAPESGGQREELGHGHYSLDIEFLSDWHIGEGAGRVGQIDRIVRRHPEDDLPYVPAKTLTGMLRDAAEKVACGLDNGVANGRWQLLVNDLFGTPGVPALLAVGPARFALTLRQALRQKKEVAQALVFVKPGVALDERGMAREDHLRMEEVVIGGARLQAHLSLDLPKGELCNAAEAMLWAACRSLERIGGKRRRGSGRCKCELTGTPDQEKLLGLLAGNPPSFVDARQPEGKSAVNDSTPPTTQESGWDAYPLTIELRSPVVVPARTLGNVVESRDYLPGTLLLAALSRKLSAKVGPDWGARLAAGDIQIRNAYPARDMARLLPVPMALFEVKQKPDEKPDLNVIREDQEDDTQRKQCRNGYVSPELLAADEGKRPPVQISRVAQQSTTHAAVDDAQQRPNEVTGGVYTYEAISAGQVFMAELCLYGEIASKFDADGLNGPYRLGRSKKDEYGQIHLSVGDKYVPSPDAKPEEDGAFTLWLTSPLLLRDERLRPSTDVSVLKRHLERALGDTPLEIERYQVRVQREDGWQTAWHTHRPTRVGFAAGSCFLVRVANQEKTPTDLKTRLTDLQAKGIGERRAEGYGEIRINAPLLAERELEICSTKPIAASGKDEQAVLKLGGDTFARHVLKRCWQQEIERRIRAKAHDDEFRRKLLGNLLHSSTSASQLGTLRSYLEIAQDKAGIERLQGWLAHAQSKKDSPWKGVKLDWGNSDSVWEHLGGSGSMPVLGDIDITPLKQELAAEALRQLWLAVIQAASKNKPNKEH